MDVNAHHFYPTLNWKFQPKRQEKKKEKGKQEGEKGRECELVRGTQIRKEDIKMTLFANDMKENSKESKNNYQTKK